MMFLVGFSRWFRCLAMLTKYRLDRGSKPNIELIETKENARLWRL